VQAKNIATIDLQANNKYRALMMSVQGVSVCALVVAVFGADDAIRPAAAISLVVVLAVFVTGLVLSRGVVEHTERQHMLLAEAEATRQQISELFAMTDMLQAAEDHEDAGAVLMATARRLLPEFSGALYVFNNSRDRLDLATAWDVSDAFQPCETLLPSHCWALKRGKPHINELGSGTLCCMHQAGDMATLEVPMMARGQVFGLLLIATGESNASTQLQKQARVAGALADSMSLALSNIALREKLRTQSLRDPLTGLYNRRYMEDALERYINLAERTGSATSIIMIDLDNFKRLNDEHGHAKGDSVLRDVAGQLSAALRPSDVVARYGGEELIVILPNCGLEDSAAKAEMLRLRIEGLSDAHGASISASFGVATVPETSTSKADVIPTADAALYVAKKAGKNCVVKADRRASREEPSTPRLAVTG